MTIFSIIPESMETARIFSILSYFLNDTAVRFLPIVFRIADTDKQEFACIIFKRLRVLPVLNLPYPSYQLLVSEKSIYKHYLDLQTAFSMMSM